MSRVISGQITVTTAGTAVQGPATPASNKPTLFFLAGHPDNTNDVWFGDDGNGDVAATTGYPLKAGEQTYVYVQNLSQIWFDADTNGEKVCWFWNAQDPEA